MKKVICLALFIVSLCLFFFGCESGKKDNSNYLRIHIRADSNLQDDQSVKYVIKDKLTAYLTPLLAECDSKEKAKETVKAELKNIEEICDKTLAQKGFDYKSNAKIDNELFPLRSYNEFVFESGNYDALIIELGEAKGDNWWCMVYPPLCFTEGEENGSGEIVYKSKILEIIEEFRKKYFSNI